MYEEPISRLEIRSPSRRKFTETTYSPTGARRSVTRIVEEEDEVDEYPVRGGDSFIRREKVERSPGKYRREEEDRFGNRTVVTRYY